MVGVDTTQRVFFALWPDHATRAQLVDLARVFVQAAGGRPTPPQLMHLTLAFMGDQPASRVATLCRVGQGMRAAAFTLQLDRLGGFPRTGIGWLGAGAPQAALATLQGDLAARLRAEGFALDARPYAPHLTLARRCASPIERRLAPPLGWPITSFALVSSELGRSGPAYRLLAEWPLAAV